MSLRSTIKGERKKFKPRMTQVGMTSDISGSAIQVLKKIKPTAVSWYWVGMKRSRVPNEILK